MIPLPIAWLLASIGVATEVLVFFRGRAWLRAHPTGLPWGWAFLALGGPILTLILPLAASQP